MPARRAPFDHLDAVPLVCVFALQLVQGLAGAQQSDTTSGQDAFLDRGPGRMHGIVNAILALLPLDLGGAADARVCHRHCQGGDPSFRGAAPELTLYLDTGSIRSLHRHCMYKRHLSATVLECATVAGVSHQHGPHRGRLP